MKKTRYIIPETRTVVIESAYLMGLGDTSGHMQGGGMPVRRW